MAQSTLLIYEPLGSLPGAEYWKQYIEFYEKFWDRPASHKSAWWGAEYDEFRKSFANSLNIGTDEIRNCFFTKKDADYFVCRLGDESGFNIISSENDIPFEWLAAFDEKKRDFFYTHVGFGAVHHDSIYYTEKIGKAMERIEAAGKFLGRIEEAVSKYPVLEKLRELPAKAADMNSWLRGFNPEGEIVLNYGEICSFITRDSMKNENSVGDLKRIIASVDKGDFEKAESDLKLLNAKWDEIKSAIHRSG